MPKLSREACTPTAFVLAGGGSLGAVEVGMLRALVEAGVGPDLVVGASVGALNGVHFAGAPDADGVRRLEDVWRRIRRSDVFPVGVSRSVRALLGGAQSLVSPAPLRRLLEAHLPLASLEASAVPVHVVATDFTTGEEVLLSRGSAVGALLASTAIPAVFPPVDLDGRVLVDGGIASNTPVAAAVRLGARRVIVLPTGFSCHPDPVPRGPIAAALHALNLLIARQLVSDLERFAKQVDLCIVPPLCPVARTAYDFSGTDELIDRAAASTRHWLDHGGLEEGRIPAELRPHGHGGTSAAA